MESEKVKEIKDSIQRKINRAEKGKDNFVNFVSVDMLKMYLTLINELESENEILRKHNIGYHIANNHEAQEQLKQFAEQIKMQFYAYFDELIPSIMASKIDEVLKEFING